MYLSLSLSTYLAVARPSSRKQIRLSFGGQPHACLHFESWEDGRSIRSVRRVVGGLYVCQLRHYGIAHISIGIIAEISSHTTLKTNARSRPPTNNVSRHIFTSEKKRHTAPEPSCLKSEEMFKLNLMSVLTVSGRFLNQVKEVADLRRVVTLQPSLGRSSTSFLNEGFNST